MLPDGDLEESRLLDAFRIRCLGQGALKQATIRVEVNPESGEVVLVDEHGEPVASPTEEIGVPKLDHLAEGVARVGVSDLIAIAGAFGRFPHASVGQDFVRFFE